MASALAVAFEERPKNYDMIDLSVCIVSWNTCELLKQCIDSIRLKTNGLEYEVIVVDNSSSDETAAFLLQWGGQIKSILSKENLGFARANNRALNEAKGEFVVFLNPDTVLVDNAFKTMVTFLRNHKGFGAIGCRLLNSDGTTQMTCARAFPTPFNQFCFFLMLNRLFPKISFLNSEDLESWDHADSRPVDVVSGACLLARRDLIKTMGGFDPRIFMYSEDVDLCYRIKKAGEAIYYLATERIIHYGGSSSRQGSDDGKVSAALRQAHYYFMNKHYGRMQAVQYRIYVLLGSAVRLLISSVLLLVAFIVGGKSLSSWPRLKRQWACLLWAMGRENRAQAISSPDTL